MFIHVIKDTFVGSTLEGLDCTVVGVNNDMETHRVIYIDPATGDDRIGWFPSEHIQEIIA